MKKEFYILEALFESGNGPCPFIVARLKDEDGLEEIKRSAEMAYKVYHIWEGELTENSELVKELNEKNEKRY